MFTARYGLGLLSVTDENTDMSLDGVCSTCSESCLVSVPSTDQASVTWADIKRLIKAVG